MKNKDRHWDVGERKEYGARKAEFGTWKWNKKAYTMNLFGTWGEKKEGLYNEFVWNLKIKQEVMRTLTFLWRNYSNKRVTKRGKN